MSPALTVSPAFTYTSVTSTVAGMNVSSESSLTRVPEPDTVVLMLPVVTWAVSTSVLSSLPNCSVTCERSIKTTAVPSASTMTAATTILMMVDFLRGVFRLAAPICATLLARCCRRARRWFQLVDNGIRFSGAAGNGVRACPRLTLVLLKYSACGIALTPLPGPLRRSECHWSMGLGAHRLAGITNEPETRLKNGCRAGERSRFAVFSFA